MTRKKLIPLCIGGAVLLTVVGWKSYGWWLQHKLESYKSELVAHGEKLTIPELMAERREPASNQADVVTHALSQIRTDILFGSNPPPIMRMVQPGRALVGWKEPLLTGNYYGLDSKKDVPLTNTWVEFAEDLARSSEAIESLRELTGSPNLDFRLDFTAGEYLMLPHLAPMKRGALALSYAAMVDLHNGNTASAARTVRSMIALSEGFRDEPMLISQLVRIAMVQITINTTWELLQAPDLAEADLKAIQADFERLDFRRSQEQSLVMERAMGNMMIRRFRERGDIFGRGSAGGMGAAPVTTTSGFERFSERAKEILSPRELRKSSSELAWQSALSYEDELRHLRGIEIAIAAIRATSNRCFWEVRQEAHAKMEALSKSEFKADEDNLFWGESDDTLSGFRMTITDTGWTFTAFKKVEQVETMRALVITAIALKRYTLRHGQPPDDLGKLVPEFLAKPARDPVDGKPLRYRVAADGSWSLYSVGENGVDDGGDPKSPTPARTSSVLRGRDWVWPVPATDADIRAWKERIRTNTVPFPVPGLAPVTNQ